MAKAINWPQQFLETILAEDETSLYAAVRLGRLYYDGGYWLPNEEVDIRCNHNKLRRAVVRGALACMPIGHLSAETLSRLKPTIQSHRALIDYLKETYNQPVDEATEVTVVTYQNLPLDPETVAECLAKGTDATGRHL